MNKEVLTLLDERGLRDWAKRGRRCLTELADFQLVCSCRTIEPRFRCGLNGLCDSCAEKRRRKIVEMLVWQFKDFPLWKERKGYGLTLLTLTQKNVKSYDYGVFLLKRALKKWRRTKYGGRVKGGIFVFETSKGEIEGLIHIHIHLLVSSHWLDNRDFSNAIPELGLNMSDLAFSWYQATEYRDYIVDVRPLTNKRAGLEYIFSYLFKLPEGLGADFRVSVALSQYKKRSYSRFGSLYNLKTVKIRSVCFMCGENFAYVSNFELLEYGCDMKFCEKPPEPCADVGLLKWFKEG